MITTNTGCSPPRFVDIFQKSVAPEYHQAHGSDDCHMPRAHSLLRVNFSCDLHLVHLGELSVHAHSSQLQRSNCSHSNQSSILSESLLPSDALTRFILPQSRQLIIEQSPLLKISATVQQLAHSNNTVPNGLKKGNPSFHLLITDPEQSVGLCRTLLSAAILDYPPPTLLNFNNTSPTAESQADGMRAVSDFLMDDSKISNQDLVLIVDGKNTWFQLPPRLIIERYQTVIALSNAWSTEQHYGELYSSTNGDFKSEAGCKQRVVWAAGKIRASAADLAGFSAPVPPMLSVLDANTGSNDKRGPIKNPRNVHSGAVIGPAFHIKAIYLAALAKLENEKEPATPDALISRMFEEQESCSSV